MKYKVIIGIISVVILAFLSILFMGFALALMLYDRHLCCDMGSHSIYWLAISILCFIGAMVLISCFKKKKGEEDK